MSGIVLLRDEGSGVSMKLKHVFRRWIFLPVSCLIMGTVSRPSRSESVEEANLPSATIHVRAIHASDRVPEEAVKPADRIHIDASLADISSKLLKLPYHSFKLAQEQSVAIGLRRKKPVGITGAHQVFIRPLAIENEDVCLWISWRGEDGDKVLDTRIHLSPGESFVAGTDSTHNSGTIIAIGVDPVR